MTDEQLGLIMTAIDNLGKRVDANTEHLVFLIEEITAIKITQKEMQKNMDVMQKDINTIKSVQARKEHELVDYQAINECAHSLIISIIEERFQTIQEEKLQNQDSTSKMQLCHT